MPTYLHPGVYLEELPAGVQPIQAVGTSTAAFVGFARQGPIGSAQLVSTWDDYQSQFGGIFAGDPPDLMGQTVSAFFANGGSRAYIVRLADGATAATALLLDPSSAPAPTDKVFRLSASSAGAWANSVSVQVTPASETSSGAISTVSLVVRVSEAPAPGLPAIEVASESYTNVGFDPTQPNYIEKQLVNSALLTVDDAAGSTFMFGESISGAITVSDFSQLNGKGITVAVNAAPLSVAFAGLTASSTLADVAGAIQAAVRPSPPGADDALNQFTATAALAAKQLTLRAGAGSATSAVVVTPATPPADDATGMLKLGTAAGGTRRAAPLRSPMR